MAHEISPVRPCKALWETEKEREAGWRGLSRRRILTAHQKITMHHSSSRLQTIYTTNVTNGMVRKEGPRHLLGDE